VRIRPSRRAAVFAAVWIPAATAGAAAQPRPAAGPDTLFVSGEVAPAVVRIGERVAVRVRMPLPQGGGRLLGPPAPVEMGPVDLVVSEPMAAGPDSTGWRLEAAFFATGDVDLTRVPFRLETAAGEIPVRLLPSTISVVSSLPDSVADADIRPIKGPLDVPVRWRWGRIAAAFAVLAAAGAGLVLWWRRRARPVPVVAPAVPDLPPEVIALRALKELEADALPARGLQKEHYSRLSLILRRYLEDRFRVPAVESTTGEIQEALERGRPLGGSGRERLLALFVEADLVKFAKFEPGADAAREALNRGKDWLNRAASPAGNGGTA
jgi:hypothetical protein